MMVLDSVAASISDSSLNYYRWESPRDSEEIKSLGADAANVTLPLRRMILSIFARRGELMFGAQWWERCFRACEVRYGTGSSPFVVILNLQCEYQGM